MTDADGSGNGVGGGEDPAKEGTDDATHAVSAFLRNRGEILLLRRSDAVGTYSERWGGVSGYAEGDPDARVVLEDVLAGIDRALEADRTAAERAREYTDGTILTLSRSGTVLAALRVGEPDRVFVAESRPAERG